MRILERIRGAIAPQLVRARDAVWRLIDTVLHFMVLPSRARDEVLICRLDRLGDFVLWLEVARPFAAALHTSGVRVTLLANREWAELAQDEAVFDNIIALDVRRFRNQPFYRLATQWRIRRAGFSAVYSPRASRESGLEDVIVRASSAPHRVGVSGINENQPAHTSRRSDDWYTRLIELSPEPASERHRNRAVLRALNPNLSPTESVYGNRSIPRALSLPDRYFVLVPGGGAAGRRWPAMRYASIASAVYERFGVVCVITGGANERDIGDCLAASMSKGGVVNLIGRISLSELVSVIAGARFVIANETGPVQIATAAGVDTVCIAGGGHFGRFVPDPLANGEGGRPRQLVVYHEMACYHCNWRCRFVDVNMAVPPCIDNIDTAAVMRCVERLLLPDVLHLDVGA